MMNNAHVPLSSFHGFCESLNDEELFHLASQIITDIKQAEKRKEHHPMPTWKRALFLLFTVYTIGLIIVSKSISNSSINVLWATWCALFTSCLLVIFQILTKLRAEYVYALSMTMFPNLIVDLAFFLDDREHFCNNWKTFFVVNLACFSTIIALSFFSALFINITAKEDEDIFVI